MPKTLNSIITIIKLKQHKEDSYNAALIRYD